MCCVCVCVFNIADILFIGRICRLKALPTADQATPGGANTTMTMMTGNMPSFSVDRRPVNASTVSFLEHERVVGALGNVLFISGQI